jgi:glutamine---fructose-6-phosphate transaminase (isomerizing)
MCGIFAQASSQPVADILIEGLRRLEYRGYDSAGIATIENGNIRRVCAVGKVSALAHRSSELSFSGTAGIAHTRWATHGEPSEQNAHPHIAPGVAVVHNGIVENHQDLRRALLDRGARFQSQTDTEVIPWLISEALAAGADVETALDSAVKSMTGTFALAAMTVAEPNVIRAVQKGSPLAVGMGKSGALLASDPNALAGMASEAIILENGDRAELRRDQIIIRNAAGKCVDRRSVRVAADTVSTSLGEYQHAMLKEIHEQPEIVSGILEAYRSPGAVLSALSFDFSRVEKVTIVACGTSYLAAAIARRWFQELAGLQTEIAIASELRYEPLAPARQGEIAIVISQSGETADTIGAMHRLQERGIPVLALVNQVHSTIGRDADCHLPLLAGREIGVASTKAFSAQLMVLAHLVHAAALRRGMPLAKSMLQVLVKVPEQINAVLHNEPAVIEAACRMVNANNALFVGRGSLYPVALEGALKLKETSYIHAEGFAAGELKHGPIELVDSNTPVFAIASSGALFEKSASNIREIAARGGRITLVGDRAAMLSLSEVAQFALTVPQCAELTQPMVSVIPLQLLAYHVACQKGLDVDRPRNLAKSVTVE